MNSPIFHRVLGRIKSQKLMENTTLAAGVSGGADSMALLALLMQAQRVLKFELVVFHFFHGDEAEDSTQTDYRFKAQAFVRSFCDSHEIPFFSNASFPEDLQSEAEFRAARYSYFADTIAEREAKTVLALGHHQQDAVETQLIQLIRGAGASSFGGFCREYSEFGNESFPYPILRPLIMESQEDLHKFLQQEEIAYLEDPSNQKDIYLRNWLRNEWLPQLEDKRPGSLKSLSRSFFHIAEALSDTNRQDSFRAIVPERIHRRRYEQLNAVEQSHLLFQFLRRMGVRDLQRSQIEEIRKRLDSEQKSLSFEVAGCRWETDKDWIKVSALDVPYSL